MTSHLEKRAVAATWWSVVEIVARYGVQFVVMIVLARLLAPSDFGLIAMLLVFVGVATLLVDAGFGTALIQRQKTTDDDETTAFLTSVSTGVGAGLVLWFVAPAIANFYSQPQLTSLLRLLVFMLPLAGLAAVPDALLTQQLNFRARACAEVVASTCSSTVAIVLASYGFGASSLAWQAILLIGIRALMLWLLSGWRPRGHLNATSLNGLFAFGGYMLVANLLNVIAVRLQALLIGKMFDSRALGYYTIAQNTQQAPAQVISGILNRVGLPIFSTVATQPDKLAGGLRLSLRVAMFVFVPCMVGLAVIAKPTLAVLYGTQWLPAAPLLSILAMATMFWPIHALNLTAIAARGRSDMIFRLEIIKDVVSIALIVAASFISVIGVALAVLVSGVFSVVINTWYSHSLLNYGMWAQMRDQSATLLLSGAAAGAAWLGSHWIHSPPLSLAIAIILAVTVYIGGAMLFRVAAWLELTRIVRSLWSTMAGSFAAHGDHP